MSLMVSISGIRGIVGDSLTPPVIVKYISAFAEYCKRGTVVIGRDGRITGTAIAEIVRSTLSLMGCEVRDLGICPTPTVGLAVEHFKATGGIAITASHNPMIWNGLKFFTSTGIFLDAQENKAFWAIAERASFTYVRWDKQGGIIDSSSFLRDHINSVLRLSYLKPEAIQKKKFRVVLDCVNAAGGKIAPQLLRELGCTVVEMNCEVNGVFSHTPEPIPENLTDLARRVREERADVGIAVDPDVDRLVIITEQGEPFIEEYSVTSAVEFILAAEEKAGRKNHHVVVNLSTTRAVDDVAARYGAIVVRTPVGEINVVTKMRDIGAIVGGEGSGGVILPAVHLGRDAIVGIGLFLQMLTDFGGTVSQLRASLPQYAIVKNRIELGTIKADVILDRIHKRYSQKTYTNTEDGLKIDFPSSWVHLRKSNTEPIIRIIAEAKTHQEAQQLVDQFTSEIQAS